MVLPGSQKPFEAFRADEADCRQYAYSAIGGPAGEQAAANSAAASAVAGTLIGAAAGAAIGSVAGAGAGGGVQAASKKPDIKLSSEKVLTFTLQSPVTIVPTTKPARVAASTNQQ